MSRIVFALVASAALFAPLAAADGLLPVNAIVNGDFDTSVTPGGVGPLRPVLDRCVGVGHQVLVPLYSPWADWAIAGANGATADPATVVPLVTDEDFAADATTYPAAYAGEYVADPELAVECDPHYQDAAQPNPWNSLSDEGFMWSNDPGTTFQDADGDGDNEAVIPSVPVEHNHNLWQSVATSTQLFSADFDAFEFTLESGAIRSSANVQIGLSLTPSYMQSPWVGLFWEGAVLFRANDMVPDGTGRVSMDPIAKGEIICPGGYTPCLDFKAEYDAATSEEKATLLGQTRIVQTSFWSFNNAAGPVAIDDVTYVGAKTAAETVPNAGNV